MAKDLSNDGRSGPNRRSTASKPGTEHLDSRVGTPFDPDKFIPILLAFGKQGKSVTMFCANIGISPTVYHDWRVKYPEFKEASIMYQVYSQAYWQEYARDNLDNMNVNIALYRAVARSAGADPDLVEIRGIGSKKDPNFKMKVVMDALDNGQLTVKDAKGLADIVSIQTDVIERTEIFKDVEALKKLTEMKS